MTKHIRTALLVLILSLTFCIPGFAQILSSTDGFAYFNVNNNWRKISVNGTRTTEIISIAYGRNTALGLKKLNTRFGFRELRYCDYATKEAVRDDLINTSLRNLRSQGFYITVSSATISNNVIIIVYDCYKDGQRYRGSETFVVKEYQGYNLVQFSPGETELIKVVFNAIDNLYVQGVPWDKWINNQ